MYPRRSTRGEARRDITECHRKRDGCFADGCCFYAHQRSISRSDAGTLEHRSSSPLIVCACVLRMAMTLPEMIFCAHVPHIPVRHENGAWSPIVLAKSSNVPCSCVQTALIPDRLKCTDRAGSGSTALRSSKAGRTELDFPSGAKCVELRIRLARSSCSIH